MMDVKQTRSTGTDKAARSHPSNASEQIKTLPFVKMLEGLSPLLTTTQIVLLSIYMDRQIYFSDKCPEHEGWFYHQHHKITQKWGLSDHLIRKDKRRLIELGLIYTQNKGIPRKEWIWVDTERLERLIQLNKQGEEEMHSELKKIGVGGGKSQQQELEKVEGGYPNFSRELPSTRQRNCPQRDKGIALNETKNIKQIKGKQIKGRQIGDRKYISSNFNDSYNENKLEGEDAKPTAPIQPESQRPRPRPRQKIEAWMFPHFWTAYPRKQAKKKAKAIWDKLCHQSDRPTWGEIRRAIAQQKKTVQWQDKQYIPQPTTWLNQGRWEDDIDALGGYTSDSFQDPAKAEEYELDRARKDLLRWFEREQGKHRPTWDKMPDPMSPEGATYMLWNDMIPRPDSLLRRFEEWLRDQDWIGDPAPGHYKPGGATVVRFLQYINDKIGGFDVFTGRSLE